MQTIEYFTDRFAGTEEQKAEVLAWSERYATLIKGLGELGTEVRVSRTLENDQDIPPFNFVRDAQHEFVFPPQQTSVSEDNSGVVDNTSGYQLIREDIRRSYDLAHVRGHLEVSYDDAESRIAFSVRDLMGESELPEEVQALLDQVNAPTPVA
jgi:hypothetical protein